MPTVPAEFFTVDAVREKEFSGASVQIIDAAPVTITNAEAVGLSESDNVTVSFSGDTVTLSGKWTSGFSDQIMYVDKGKCAPTDPDTGEIVPVKDQPDPLNLLQDPVTVIGFENVPANKDLLDIKTDTTQFVTCDIKIDYEYEDPEAPGEMITDSITHPFKIKNDFEAPTIWINDYMDKYGGHEEGSPFAP